MAFTCESPVSEVVLSSLDTLDLHLQVFQIEAISFWCVRGEQIAVNPKVLLVYLNWVMSACYCFSLGNNISNPGKETKVCCPNAKS